MQFEAHELTYQLLTLAKGTMPHIYVHYATSQSTWWAFSLVLNTWNRNFEPSDYTRDDAMKLTWSRETLHRDCIFPCFHKREEERKEGKGGFIQVKRLLEISHRWKMIQTIQPSKNGYKEMSENQWKSLFSFELKPLVYLIETFQWMYDHLQMFTEYSTPLHTDLTLINTICTVCYHYRCW